MSQDARPDDTGPLYAAQGLLDRQVTHGEDALVCKVDDVELVSDADGRVIVTALLVGPLALGPRVGGLPGRLMAAVARRLRMEPDPAPARVPFEHVTRLGPVVQLDASAADLGLAPLERWTDEHLIGRIPGAAHEDR